MALHLAAQGAGDGGTGGEEIDIDATRPVVARGVRLADAPVGMPRPADTPLVQAADRIGSVLAQDARQALVAQAAASRDGVGQVIAPVVRHLLAERHRHRHLRHHGRAAPADQAAIDQQHRRVRLVGRDRGGHAGRAGTDHQHVGRKPHTLPRRHALPRIYSFREYNKNSPVPAS